MVKFVLLYIILLKITEPIIWLKVIEPIDGVKGRLTILKHLLTSAPSLTYVYYKGKYWIGRKVCLVFSIRSFW